jgi:fluoroquinolone resistance protein
LTFEKKQILKLRKRWTEQTTNDVVNRLINGSDLSGICTVTYGGKLFTDLRGLQYAGSIHNLDRENIDFSFAIVAVGQITGKRLENCRFVGFKMTGTFLVDRVLNCDFSFASLKDTHLSGEFSGCSFREGNLCKSNARQTRFIKCDFSKTNLEWAHFMYCTFEECTFHQAKFGKGSLAGSKFYNGDIAEQDFKDTITHSMQLL